MKQSFFVAALAAAMTSLAVQAGDTYRVEECGPAAEAFSFYLDASGSMMETIGDVKEKAQEEYEKFASEGGAQTRERPVRQRQDGRTASRGTCPSACAEERGDGCG